MATEEYKVYTAVGFSLESTYRKLQTSLDEMAKAGYTLRELTGDKDAGYTLIGVKEL